MASLNKPTFAHYQSSFKVLPAVNPANGKFNMYCGYNGDIGDYNDR